jgi:hypothetical protein
MATYKAVEIKHKSMTWGRMTTEDLEKAINTHAKEGWKLDKIISGETASFVSGSKDVFLLIFERP